MRAGRDKPEHSENRETMDRSALILTCHSCVILADQPTCVHGFWVMASGFPMISTLLGGFADRLAVYGFCV